MTRPRCGFGVEGAANRKAWHRCEGTGLSTVASRESALRGLSRAGAARRSEPLTGAATRLRSRAWGGLRRFATGPRARPAERTSPPSGAGSGVGEARRFGQGVRVFWGVSTRNDTTPSLVRRVRRFMRVCRSCARIRHRDPGHAPDAPGGRGLHRRASGHRSRHASA